ncbi:hypothetical protein EJB05_40511, partial [Eragrostis curvula]
PLAGEEVCLSRQIVGKRALSCNQVLEAKGDVAVASGATVRAEQHNTSGDRADLVHSVERNGTFNHQQGATRQQAPSSVSPTTYRAAADRRKSGTGGSATRENSIDPVSRQSSTLPFSYFQ